MSKWVLLAAHHLSASQPFALLRGLVKKQETDHFEKRFVNALLRDLASSGPRKSVPLH
jgi:hypothetical protein